MISTGHPLPQETEAPSYDRATRLRLPDGAVVETMERRSSPSRTVTVTHLSGVQIQVSSTDASEELLPFAVLDEIALNPGFGVSR